MDTSPKTDPRLLLLHEADNVFAVTRPIEAGTRFSFLGEQAVLDRPAGLGFKIARRSIARGDAILKYGVRIGIASEPIPVGHLVHIHNVESAYLPSTRFIGRPGNSEAADP